MIIILKIIGVLLILAFAGMCMWITLKSTFNLGKKDDYDKY